MAEQRALVAEIKYDNAFQHELRGKGNTTARIVNALRDYFNDATKLHYWEIDTTIPGGSYDLTTNLSPLNSGTTYYVSLVLKPKASASGGLQQRIVFVAGGNHAFADNKWGTLKIGYLPDGYFDAIDGVKHDTNYVLNTAPAEWSGFREITSLTTTITYLKDAFTVVEYRDDPILHSDPGQSLFIALHSQSNIDDYDYNNLKQQIWTERNTNKWEATSLVGRVIQPFTRYHELAIGNSGDGLFTGRWGNTTNNILRPMAEAGWSEATYINNSSIVRIAPNCWGLAFPYYGSTNTTFLQSESHHFSLTDWRQPLPIYYAAGEKLVVRNGLAVNVNHHAGVYGHLKQVKQIGVGTVGWDTGWIASDNPASKRAWGKMYSNKSLSYDAGRVLLWDADGPLKLNYYQP